MAVPHRSKRRGIEEKGVKRPSSFFKRANEKRIIMDCSNCKEKKVFHYVCKNCFFYKNKDFSHFFVKK